MYATVLLLARMYMPIMPAITCIAPGGQTETREGEGGGEGARSTYALY